MPLYKYIATNSAEENTESGTIVAKSEEDARLKLKQLHMEQVRIKKVDGLMGLVGQFTANIK